MRILFIAFVLLSIMCFCTQRKANTSTAPVVDTTSVAYLLAHEPLKDTSLVFQSWSPELNINTEYIAQMTTAERAALGYVATFIGCQCQWDGKANEDLSNLDCAIITALGLGYQCSDEHLGFLRQWFATDSLALESLDASNCPNVPFTATVQNYFEQIDLEISGDSIIVSYQAAGINVRAEKTWTWSEIDCFLLTAKGLVLLSEDRSEVIVKSFGE